MTLDDLFEEFQDTIYWINRTSKSDVERKYTLLGAKHYIVQMLGYVERNSFPTMESLTPEEQKKYNPGDGLYPLYKVRALGEEKIVYLDDYGQCLAIEKDGNFVGLGSYNSNVIEDIVYIMLTDAIEKAAKGE